MPNNNYFAQLSPEQKAELFSIYVNAGYKTLSSISNDYNSKIGNLFYNGGEEDSVEKYIQHKADSVRNTALEKSLSRVDTRDPIIGYTNPKKYIDELKNESDSLSNVIDSNLRSVNLPLQNEVKGFTFPMLDKLEQYISMLASMEKYKSDDHDHLPFTPVDEKLRVLAENIYNNEKLVDKKESLESTIDVINKDLKSEPIYGANCISTATDNYGNSHWVTGNLTFAENPSKYGFKKISISDIKPGDIVQTKHMDHAMIFNRFDENGSPRFNYSRGNRNEIVKNGRYVKGVPFDDENYNIYRFVGNKNDIEQWTNEYNKRAYGGTNGDGFFPRMLGKLRQAFGVVSLPEEVEESGYDWTENDVKNLAKAFENRESKAYVGVKGDILGGYGHKLTEDEIAKYWNRKTGKAVGTIEDSVIDGWLDSDMGKAFKSVERYYGKDLPSNIWAALSSLSFQGGDLLIRGKRDSNNQIRKDWSGGSPLFEEAVKKYLEDKSDASMQGIIDQMQYKDDGNPKLSGLSSRYGLYRAMIDNTADPSKIYEYKNDGTYKLYKSNKKKN